MRGLWAVCVCAGLVLGAMNDGAMAGDRGPAIKVGMIGLDTSHAVAFTRIFAALRDRVDVPAVEVVAGWPHSVPDNPASHTRVAGFTQTLRSEFGVRIVDSIEELLPLCDAVMIESVDGRTHLEQARPVLRAGKPLFIDKPLAASFEDARRIVELSRETGTPFFSASALRFTTAYQEIRNDPALGEIQGCMAWSPCVLESNHPDLYWYGIHGVDPLFMIMGPGCEEVWRVATGDFDLVAGRWADGRIGTFRGIRRGAGAFGITVWGMKEMRHSPAKLPNLYEGLVIEIARFFRTGKAPVTPEETLELFAFMTAADLSKARGGAPVKLSEVMGDKQ